MECRLNNNRQLIDLYNVVVETLGLTAERVLGNQLKYLKLCYLEFWHSHFRPRFTM